MILLKKVLLFSILSNFCIFSAAQTGKWQTTFFDIENRLPNNNIQCINQDTLQFIWIGTENGLCRFDGSVFKNYVSIPGENGSLPENNIRKIFIDSKKRLLIGTSGGLSLYDVYKDNFKPVAVSEGRFSVRDITEDQQGNIWIATEGNGLIKLTGDLKTAYHSGITDSSTLIGNYIWSLCADGNFLWIGTLDGRLVRYDQLTGKYDAINELGSNNGFISYIAKDDAGNIIVFAHESQLNKLVQIGNSKVFKVTRYQKMPGKYLNAITKRENGLFWLSGNEGITVYNSITDSFYTLRKETEFKDLPVDLPVGFVFTDQQKNFWVAGRKGLYLIVNTFKHFCHSNDTFPESFLITSLTESTKKRIIAGSYTGTIFIWDSTVTEIPRKIDILERTGIKSCSILRIIETGDNKYLIATYRGLFYYDGDKDKLTRYAGKNQASTLLLKDEHIYDMLLYDNTTVWLATNGNGIKILDIVTGEITGFNQKNSAIINDYCISLLKDHSGKVWIGTYNGLSVYDPETKKFDSFLPDNSLAGSLSHNWIYCLYEDSRSRIWVGTYNGLNLYRPQTKTFRHFNKNTGLSDNVINAITEDFNNNLWISTTNGITKIAHEDFNTTTYDRNDGLNILQFSRNTGLKNEKGILYFGGNGGILSFDPQKILNNPISPVVRFTGLKIFNNLVNSVDHPEILPSEIICLNEIKIPYKQNVITLTFNAFNFINSEENGYAYRLDGFDKSWQLIGNKNEVTYTNLNPGKYLFRVKAANNDGIWNTRESELRIIIMPPWWKTWWFKVLLILLIMSISAGFYFYRLSTLRSHNNQLENLVRERTKEVEIKNTQLSALNTTKDKFFSIIAHDLKNPFNSLIGFSKLLNSDFNKIPDDRKHQMIRILDESASRIYRLLENLLEWAGTQTGNIKFYPEVFNLKEIIEINAELFSDQLETKNNKLKLELDEDLIVIADQNMVQTIIRNLLNNAIKYTEDGEILLKAGKKSEYIITSISDSGIGIPQNRIERLFEIDEIKSTDGTKGEKGSALGLLICKEFVEKNHGKIWVESNPGKGSCFTFSLPQYKTKK